MSSIQLEDNLPDYRALYEEFHSRPFPVITPPVSVSHIAVSYKPEKIQEVHEHIAILCRQHSVASPEPDATCFYQEFNNFSFRWEAHTEFCTYTIITRQVAETPFTNTACDLLTNDWVQGIQGSSLAALHVEIRGKRETSLSRQERLEYFEKLRVISANIGVKRSEFWSTFRLHSDGFNRVLIYDNGHSKRQLGVLLRSILEMETYRNMALLALPKMQSVIGNVHDMEIKLAELIDQISRIEAVEDEQSLLGRLTELSARNEKLISDCTYRVSASNAYYELTEARLDELKEREKAEQISVKRFVERRLRPAHKTCNAIYERMQDLSRRIERASELLRTRINVALESQNQQLLVAMEKRSKVSLALQQTVEGLSVAVITYYVISLLKISASSGLKALGMDPNLVIGISVPIVLITVWTAMRRVRNKVEKALED